MVALFVQIFLTNRKQIRCFLAGKTKNIVIEQNLCWLMRNLGVTMRPPFEGSIYI